MTEVEHGSQLPTLGGALHLSSVLLWPCLSLLHRPLALPFASFTCTYPLVLSPYILPFPFALALPVHVSLLKLFCLFHGVPL